MCCPFMALGSRRTAVSESDVGRPRGCLFRIPFCDFGVTLGSPASNCDICPANLANEARMLQKSKHFLRYFGFWEHPPRRANSNLGTKPVERALVTNEAEISHKSKELSKYIDPSQHGPCRGEAKPGPATCWRGKSKRTKPESGRKERVWQNMSGNPGVAAVDEGRTSRPICAECQRSYPAKAGNRQSSLALTNGRETGRTKVSS